MRTRSASPFADLTHNELDADVALGRDHRENAVVQVAEGVTGHVVIESEL
ncbi:hypothetical protein [Rhodococcoides kyotonense]|nr:hypothetical protein [Rhodococcus kyotonensis]